MVVVLWCGRRCVARPRVGDPMTGPRVCPDHIPGRMHDAVRYSPLYDPARWAWTIGAAVGYATYTAVKLLGRKLRP